MEKIQLYFDDLPFPKCIIRNHYMENMGNDEFVLDINNYLPIKSGWREVNKKQEAWANLPCVEVLFYILDSYAYFYCLPSLIDFVIKNPDYNDKLIDYFEVIIKAKSRNQPSGINVSSFFTEALLEQLNTFICNVVDNKNYHYELQFGLRSIQGRLKTLNQ